jgi:hypothetical protein
MTSFIAVYRGQTIGEAKLIAVTADPALVAEVSAKLLHKSATEKDNVINALEDGRQSALQQIVREVEMKKRGNE